MDQAQACLAILAKLVENDYAMPEKDLLCAFTSGELPGDNLGLIIQQAISQLAVEGKIKTRNGKIYIVDPPFIVEVKRRQTNDDPPLDVYNVITRSGQSVWHFTLGSPEQLTHYLAGMNTILAMVWGHVSMRWPVTFSHAQPWGIRWIIAKGEIMREEELDENGEVIPPI